MVRSPRSGWMYEPISLPHRAVHRHPKQGSAIRILAVRIQGNTLSADSESSNVRDMREVLVRGFEDRLAALNKCSRCQAARCHKCVDLWLCGEERFSVDDITCGCGCVTGYAFKVQLDLPTELDEYDEQTPPQREEPDDPAHAPSTRIWLSRWSRRKDDDVLDVTFTTEMTPAEAGNNSRSVRGSSSTVLVAPHEAEVRILVIQDEHLPTQVAIPLLLRRNPGHPVSWRLEADGPLPPSFQVDSRDLTFMS